MLVVGGVVVLFFLWIGSWFATGLLTMSNKNADIEGRVGEIWNNVDRASQLLPQLQDQLKFTTSEQQKLVEQITLGRNSVLAASKLEHNQANLQNLTGVEGAAFALQVAVERYPDFGIPDIQKGLLTETAGSFNRIAYARHQLIEDQVSFNRSRNSVGLLVRPFFPHKTVLGSDANPAQQVPPSRLGQN